MKRIEGEEVRKVRDCPVGSFLRIIGKNGAVQKTVWVRSAYDRSTGKYELYAYDDINRFRNIKGDSLVLVGFTF